MIDVFETGDGIYSIVKDRDPFDAGLFDPPQILPTCFKKDLEELRDKLNEILEESPDYEAGLKDGIDAVIGDELQEEIVRDYPRFR